MGQLLAFANLDRLSRWNWQPTYHTNMRLGLVPIVNERLAVVCWTDEQVGPHHR